MKRLNQEVCINVRCNACQRSLVTVPGIDQKCKDSGEACGLRPIMNSFSMDELNKWGIITVMSEEVSNMSVPAFSSFVKWKEKVPWFVVEDIQKINKKELNVLYHLAQFMFDAGRKSAMNLQDKE